MLKVSRSFTCHPHVYQRMRSAILSLQGKHSPDGATPDRDSRHLIAAYYSLNRPWMGERLSWLGWWTCSGRFTFLRNTHQLQVERRTGNVCRRKTAVRCVHCAVQLTWLTHILEVEYQRHFYHVTLCQCGTCCCLVSVHLWQAIVLLEWRNISPCRQCCMMA